MARFTALMVLAMVLIIGTTVHAQYAMEQMSSGHPVMVANEFAGHPGQMIDSTQSYGVPANAGYKPSPIASARSMEGDRPSKRMQAAAAPSGSMKQVSKIKVAGPPMPCGPIPCGPPMCMPPECPLPLAFY